MSHQIRYPDGRTFGPYPLDDIKKYSADGTFPAGTEVQIPGGWQEVSEWLKAATQAPKTSVEPSPPPPASAAAAPSRERSRKEPTRCGPLHWLLLGVPLLWMILHGSLLSWEGAGWIWFIWFISGVAALVIRFGKRRTQNPQQILAPLLDTHLKKKITLGIAGVVFLAISIKGALARYASSQIDEALERAAKSTCGFEEEKLLADSKLSWAQESTLRDLREECDEQRKRLEREREEKEYDESCKQIVDAVLEGRAVPESAALVVELNDSARERYSRIGRRQLMGEDLLQVDSGLPCADDRVFDALVEAAERSPRAWEGAVEVSPELVRVLEQRLLPESVASVLRKGTSAQAKVALNSDDLTVRQAAKMQCELADNLGAPAPAECETLAAVIAAQKKAQEQREAAERAREEAKEKLCNRLSRAAEDCTMRGGCDLFSPCEGQCWANYRRTCP